MTEENKPSLEMPEGFKRAEKLTTEVVYMRNETQQTLFEAVCLIKEMAEALEITMKVPETAGGIYNAKHFVGPALKKFKEWK